MLVVAHLAVVVLAASSVLAGPPDLPVSPPTSSVGVISPPVTPTTMLGNSASTPIPSPPTPPIGMRRMYPLVPPSLPSASPPVGLPEQVQELANSERVARGLPVHAPLAPLSMPSASPPVGPPEPVQELTNSRRIPRGLPIHAPLAPPSMPSASPPVRLPEPVQELANSERVARGLPIHAPLPPPSMPSASPPVHLPEPVQELTNSERLARGLPIRAPRLLRVRPGSPLEGLDKGALLHGGMARLPRPSKLPKIPKRRLGPSMLPHVALPIPTPPVPVRRWNGPAAPAIGSTDGLVRFCAVSGACQAPKARMDGEDGESEEFI